MPEFLVLIPPHPALQKWLSEFPNHEHKVEEIDSSSGLNRITAEDIQASKPIPEFPRSSMDGYAVRAKDSFGASESLPAYFTVIGEAPMGKRTNLEIGLGQAVLIHTGGMLPAGADAVVMLENTQRAKQGELEVSKAVASNENVILVGEDIAAGQIAIPAATRLRAGEIGSLMALGQTKIKVIRKPLVGILSSGDEVVEPQVEPEIGQVRDINAYTLSAHVEEWGGQPLRLGIVPDDIDALRSALSSALKQCDAVVISAGSSASVRDHTSLVMDEMGAPGVLVHGVNVKPGKPTILAVCDGKPVVGLPGNPVSALVIMRIFIRPMIERLLGVTSSPVQPSIHAVLTTNLASQAGREDWWPVHLAQTADGLQAEPVHYKSNLIFNYANADGLIMIPADATGISAGTKVDVFPM
jgi:molybdopterin molybdotransferase